MSAVNWRAEGALAFRVSGDGWIRAGWWTLREDFRRGAGHRFRYDLRTGGPFLGVDVWF
jgi:hypothetical protein